ncbi:MAG TPA: hypothetical protein VJ021_06340 [Thermoplasmata archaeon]|nr:hypothetical protein [Thermoplasmata archaeon]
MAGRDAAFGVVVLGAIGTLLIFVFGVVVLALAASVSAPIQFTTDVVTVGAVSILLAILSAIFLFLYWDSVDTGDQAAWGVLLALMGAFSLWVGGGFFVGFLLTFTAGIVAVILANLPDAPSSSIYPSVPTSPRDRTTADRHGEEGLVTPTEPKPSAPNAMWMPAGGILVWLCLKCDHQNPINTQVCENCGVHRKIPT